nr:MAG TPA: hypothetical protein [Caudoviricetes sp.]
MAAPSDYRHDPFSDVSTAATFTERHIIPSVSPYVINLNEIPQKNSPSTMTVKAITNVNGSTVTYGSTFAEVAANPSSNEFWSDYNTGADGDENWNTGKLLFNSSNAGQLVEIRYTATGTLAGVKSNRYPAWWLDRGDGSDGDFAPTTNTTISGLKQYKSVFIPAGVTVNINRFVKIKCQGAFINLGTITVNNRVTSGGSSDSVGQSGTCSVGGAGGSGDRGNDGAAGGALLGNLDISQDITYYGAAGGGGGQGAYVNEDGTGSGSYGGVGGAGGGSICILANSVRITGNISATGAAGGRSSNAVYEGGGGGGGGGGCIIIVANSIKNSGTLSVAGGAGGAGHQSGATGGSGILALKELGVM